MRRSSGRARRRKGERAAALLRWSSALVVGRGVGWLAGEVRAVKRGGGLGGGREAGGWTMTGLRVGGERGARRAAVLQKSLLLQ